MADWERQLARRRATITRQERALEEAIADAHADGLAWRTIGKAAGMNHERARQIGERIVRERATTLKPRPESAPAPPPPPR